MSYERLERRDAWILLVALIVANLMMFVYMSGGRSMLTHMMTIQDGPSSLHGVPLPTLTERFVVGSVAWQVGMALVSLGGGLFLFIKKKNRALIWFTCGTLVFFLAVFAAHGWALFFPYLTGPEMLP